VVAAAAYYSGLVAAPERPAAPRGADRVRPQRGSIPRDGTTPEGPGPPAGGGRRLAVSTAFFSAATGISRVAGLAREIIAASYFGVSGAMSAFTVAFQVPNLMRALFADAALQGAFVPVFTELLEKGRRREALTVAWSVFSLMTALLGALTLLFLLLAGPIIAAVTPGFDHSPELRHLTITMARLMFPVVLLLALSGIVVGMLNSLGHFSVPALTPVIWNLIIIGCLVLLRDRFSPQNEIYAYAIGVLLGTIAQFLIPLPVLFRAGIPFKLSFDWRNPDVWRVLRLMLPVTIALGLINFDALINSIFGTLVSDQAPAAIDKAFRIYQLPQGLFSVAIATVLFPTLSRLAAREDYGNLRYTMANGVRQTLLLLIPSAALMAVLSVPITRLVYQRGAFGGGATHLVSIALLCWAFSLPFQGASLLFSRTFFSLQKPWFTTSLALVNLIVNAAFSAIFYYPWGITGVVLGSVAGTLVMAVCQAAVLRRDLGGIDGHRTLRAVARIALATVVMSLASYFVWWLFDAGLGRSLIAQLVSVGAAIGAAILVYSGCVIQMNVEEAHQIRRLLPGRARL
jgi:putative peptidoglycan lipid II flippase